MVSIVAVRAHNDTLKSRGPGLVALFLGASQGIGGSTAKELIKKLNSPKFYFVVRSKSAFANRLLELQHLNPQAVIEVIETEISLLKNVDKVCKEIEAKETNLDLLYMSAGALPLGGPAYTSEGIDTGMSLSYYGRIRCTLNLLSLLKASASPRVLSVLAGGKENSLISDDFELKNNYSFANAVNQTKMMHTLAFERLAQENPSVSFLHAYPGLVQTEIFHSALQLDTWRLSWLGLIFGWILRQLLRVFMVNLEESGERQAFHATSSRYLSRKDVEARFSKDSVSSEDLYEMSVTAGNGLYLVAGDGSTSKNQKILGPLRVEGMVEKVWEHTLGVFDRVLVKVDSSTS